MDKMFKKLAKKIQDLERGEKALKVDLSDAREARKALAATSDSLKKQVTDLSERLARSELGAAQVAIQVAALAAADADRDVRWARVLELEEMRRQRQAEKDGAVQALLQAMMRQHESLQQESPRQEGQQEESRK